METVAKVGRRRLVEGETISGIARELRLARNTVKKYLNQTEPPTYRRSEQPKPKLGDYEERLESWLEQDAQRPKRQRRTARRLFEDLQAEGYAGAYDSVQRTVNAWKLSRGRHASSQAFIPLVFPPGNAGQFDWSEDWADLGGVRTKLQVAQLKLPYSRAYPLQTHEMLFDAHLHAFRLLGGIPRRAWMQSTCGWAKKSEIFCKNFFEPVVSSPLASRAGN